MSADSFLTTLNPCDGCDGECGDVCPVLEAQRLAYERIRPDPGPRCQHCPAPTPAADERSFMCTDCAIKADTEVQELRDQVERYRDAIKTALDTMATSNDMQLGPGGVARKAYAHLWHEYFAIPAGIAPTPREPGGRSEDAAGDSGAVA